MSKIAKINALQVFDSRGNPTIETEIYLDDGSKASAIVPSGASTGTHEAFELRDFENKNYLGKSVLKAIEKVNGEISKTLIGISAEDQAKIDDTLIELDGTKQKKRLGANAILILPMPCLSLNACLSEFETSSLMIRPQGTAVSSSRETSSTTMFKRTSILGTT